MHFSKKYLIIGVLCVVVLAAVLGGFAIANAANDDSSNQDKQEAAMTNLMDKIVEIYQKNTGTAIDPTELQKAFTEAQTAIRADRLDQMLQKLVDEGKITQEQADAGKTWWNSRPDKALTDEFKSWLESRPDIPGLFGIERGGRMSFGAMHRLGAQGDKINPGIHGCMPDIND